MTAAQFRSGLPEQISSLTDCPVLAIDLGFSKRSKSCGVAWRDASGRPQSEGFRFGECIEQVAGRLKGHPKAVLIIEAPLSGLFTSNGNPIERGDFERKGPSSSSGTTRYWYSGPGATTCLAVVFFLRQLLAEFRRFPDEEQPVEIILYEGFVTFKPEVTTHVSDAQLLLDSFQRPQAREVIQVEVSEEPSLSSRTSG
jgi:hypothetical protein